MRRAAEGLSPSFPGRRSGPLGVDIGLAIVLAAGAYGIVEGARYLWDKPVPAVTIQLTPSALPAYTLDSVVRLLLAYLLSLGFAIGYGYLAAHQPRVERVLISLLDILQSIPVLSFLPGVMLGILALIPSRQLGLEIGSILLIFTGQVWNLAFSFYSSLKSIPRELREVAAVYGFSRWQRLLRLELPFGAIGLLWNSIVSMAGGWFFLMACEMFVLGNRDFRLPGLGSYLQAAASAGDVSAMAWGVGAMVGVIVLIDQLIWRPLIAWSDKFKFEQMESDAVLHSPILTALRRSRLIHGFERWMRPVREATMLRSTRPRAASRGKLPRPAATAAYWVLGAGGVGVCLVVLLHAARLLGALTPHEWLTTLGGAGATFLRVMLALALATAWTVPAGVAIGFHPRWARIAQPLAQIAASVPATALFPILLLLLLDVGQGMGLASVLLMVLACQWYILFNVIAGASAIPGELREVGSVYRFPHWFRWRVVILPGIFPYLITGLITASGGAWNASIIAEYFHLQGHILSTFGLGSQISAASDSGRFDVLLLATLVMSIMVVAINRLVWRPLYRLAQNRYRLG